MFHWAKCVSARQRSAQLTTHIHMVWNIWMVDFRIHLLRNPFDNGHSITGIWEFLFYMIYFDQANVFHEKGVAITIPLIIL